jgi:hypothetical protein
LGRNGRIKKKQEKILMVMETYTVVNPWAVVIHLQNTHSTDSAMMAPIRLVLSTPLAMAPVA